VDDFNVNHSENSLLLNRTETILNVSKQGTWKFSGALAKPRQNSAIQFQIERAITKNSAEELSSDKITERLQIGF